MRDAKVFEITAMTTGSVFGSFDFGSLVSQRNLKLNNLKLQQSMMRLATGSRINSGADDPAGLIASQQLYSTLATLDAETSANQRASDQASTADGALGQASDMLIQAKTLISANANDAGLSADEKAANQMQIDSILAGVDRLAGTTTFNSQKLLDGSATISASGASLNIASIATSNIGKTTVAGTTYSLADIKSGKNASVAGDVIDQAIKDVSTERGQMGAFQANTIQSRLTTIATAKVQITGAVSMLHDTDYAAEISNQSKYQLLQAASMVMLSKSHQQHQKSTFSILG